MRKYSLGGEGIEPSPRKKWSTREGVEAVNGSMAGGATSTVRLISEKTTWIDAVGQR